MNIRELARRCNVSPATVSRYLNKSAAVSEKTARDLDAAMRESGYVAVRRAPRRGGGRKSLLIGVLAPTIDQHFFQSAIHELNRQISALGMTPVVLIMPYGDEGRVIRQIRRLPLDGIVLLGGDLSGDVMDELGRLPPPIIMCGESAADRRFSAVQVDDLAAAHAGAEYLLELGHRHIGFISDSQKSICSGFQRITGCRKAMEDHGIAWREDMAVFEGCGYTDGYEGAKRLLALHKEITALFAFSDEAAAGAITALHDLGVRVPQDVSVMGFDDLDIARRFRPAVTSVRQPLPELVAKALEILLEHISGGTRDTLSVIMPFSLRVRDSCRAISPDFQPDTNG